MKSTTQATPQTRPTRNNLLLTDASIRTLPAPDPSGRQTIHWDREITGFGVMCSGTTSARSFVVQHRGKRRTLERVEYMTLDEARDLAPDWIRALRKNVDPKVNGKTHRTPQPEAVTLGSVFDEYLLSGRAGELRDGSRDFYRAVWTPYLSDWSNLTIDQLTSAMIVERHATIMSRVKRKRGTPGGATANGSMRLLSALLRHAGRKFPEMRLADVGKAMHRGWAKERRRTRCVADDSMPAFYSALQALPDEFRRDCIELILLLGLRLREATELRWPEVDIQKRLIVLPPERTKSNREFRLPLSDRAVQVLKGLATKRRASSAFVFHSRGDGHISELDRAFADIGKAIDQRLSPHDLRRTFAGCAHRAGIDLLTIKRLLNHAEHDVTVGYLVRNDDDLRRAQQRTTDHILKLCRAAAPSPKRVIVRRHIVAAAAN